MVIATERSCTRAVNRRKIWFTQLQQLSDALVLCPTDIATRCELAALLEQLDQPEEALVNWNSGSDFRSQ